ncbi:spore coat protein U domain-containing protein [Jeongeupia wiesaeckerbachi]|uniref:spore coat protein U domain-containing protein n=1 Tax=Jeongeupia wiesaeckerbachi TaxID=3051218 RepID=UPI003D807538
MRGVLMRIWLVVAVLLSGMVQADTRGMPVTATVPGSCKFSNADDVVLDFGALVPGQGARQVSQSVAFTCSTGTQYTVAMDLGRNPDGQQRRMRGDSGSYIPYALSATPTSGNGQGELTPISLLLTASVEAAAYVDSPIGSYNDNVVLTVSP